MLDQFKFHQQMRKELEIHYRLSRHPHIVKLLGYFHDQNCVYAVQEFAPEGNLYQILLKRGYFCEAEAAQIVIQVLSALCYMQARNVIHRDIKPENILVFQQGRSKSSGLTNNQLQVDLPWLVKLCDFGWSTHSINKNRMTFCGTPDYLAPELVDHKPYDDKIDNWALGVLTYELLTGKSPFAGPSNPD
jgi:aurora kinase